MQNQYVRSLNINNLYNCGDSCRQYRSRLIKYTDSVYCRKYFNDILKIGKLTPFDFGESYFDFLVISRHLFHKEDSVLGLFYLNFCQMALRSFLFTPDYYANIMDYCFNFTFDENNTKIPKNAYGEFSYYNGKLMIDDPTTIDNRRTSIGLLPLHKVISDKNKLPDNYKEWLRSNDNN